MTPASARHGVCLDRYRFAAALALDENVSEGPPRLVLTTQAWTFPGRRSRTEDSAQAPPLSARDLVWARDDACSFRRVANRQGGAYVWDAPLPACADYLEA